MGTHYNMSKGPCSAERLTDLYLLLMLTLFPLFTGWAGYTSITAAKYSCFLLLSWAYLFLLAIIGLHSFAVGRLTLPGLRPLWRRSSPTQRLIALFILACLLSTLGSSYQAVAWLGGGLHEGFFTLLLYGLIFLTVSAFGKAKAWMLSAFGTAVSILCVICFLQLAGLNPLWLFPNGDNYSTTGIFLGTIGNIDLLAAFLCIAIPITGVGALLLRKPPLLLPTCLGVLVLAFTGVASGVVGLGLGLLLSFPLILTVKMPKTKGGQLARRLYLAAAILFVVGLVLLYSFPWAVGSTPYEISQVLHGNIQPGYGSGRIAIWQESLTLVPERPLLGGGPDTLASRLQMVFSSGTKTALVDSAHNEYLNLLVNVGILGLGLYVTALIATALSLLKTARKNPVALILGVAVLCYAIQAFFSFSICITAPFFWLVWGLLSATLSPGREGITKRAIPGKQA